MNGQTTTEWIKPAKVTEPMTVVLESATAQKYEANWQGHTSTRYRIKCKNDIMLDTTGMFVKMMIDSGAKDGDTMTFHCVKDSNGRPNYNISVKSNDMGGMKEAIKNVFGAEPVDNSNDVMAKINSLNARVTAIENKLTATSSNVTDEIPF